MVTFEEMKTAMEELDNDALVEAAEAIMAAGGADASSCMQACQEGLEEVGRRFEEGEYFVGDLVFAGELMGQIMDIIRPALSGSPGSQAMYSSASLPSGFSILLSLGASTWWLK